MSDFGDNEERLLADVLAEESKPGLRDALLGQTLQLVGRRRQLRKIQRVGSITAVFAGLLFLMWRLHPSPSENRPPQAKPYTLVSTQPFPAGAIVQTRALPADNLIVSSHTVVNITTSAGDLRDLNDEQLMELVAPSPVVLIRRGPHTAELVFVNPADRDAILRN